MDKSAVFADMSIGGERVEFKTGVYHPKGELHEGSRSYTNGNKTFFNVDIAIIRMTAVDQVSISMKGETLSGKYCATTNDPNFSVNMRSYIEEKCDGLWDELKNMMDEETFFEKKEI